MSMGPMPPLGSDAGSGPDGEDPRNAATMMSDLGSASGGPGVPSDTERQLELKEVEGLSLGRIVLRRFLRNRGAIISMVVLAVFVVVAFSSEGIVLGPISIPGWWQYGYADVPVPVNGGGPTLSVVPGPGFGLGAHPFGQDDIGHDMFARVMRGAQQSLMILFVVGIVSTILGTVVGAVAGFFGGRIDALLMRLTDLVLIVPLILLAAIVGHALAGSGSFVLALMLGLLVWTTLARLVRGEVLSLREREFVDAARVAGASNTRIIFRHILPNTVGVVIVSATLTMSAAILTETALSYLGLGVQAPDVSLGKLISDYQTAFNTRPWLFWYPGVFIVIIALTINFIGDGLRDAFDPRQKRGLNRKARQAQTASREQSAEPQSSVVQ